MPRVGYAPTLTLPREGEGILPSSDGRLNPGRVAAGLVGLRYPWWRIALGLAGAGSSRHLRGQPGVGSRAFRLGGGDHDGAAAGH